MGAIWNHPECNFRRSFASIAPRVVAASTLIIALFAAAVPAAADGSAAALDLVGQAPGTMSLHRGNAGAVDRAAAQPAMSQSFAASGAMSMSSAGFNAAIARPYAMMDAPHVFGSTALRVARTPLDWRWQQIVASPAPEAALWSGVTQKLEGMVGIEKLSAVNIWVNDTIRFADDSRAHATPDHWSTVGETLRRGEGDCEDYAIAKMHILRAAGVPASDLFLVITRDLVRRADHALLLVRVGGRFMVLDNSTDKILDAADVRDYRPIYSFREGEAWIHGYRNTTQIAGASSAPRPAASAAAPRP
jgi:predicted transglutaminase-like cysteine proteinase